MAFSEKLNYRSVTTLVQSVSLKEQKRNDLFSDENPISGNVLLFTTVSSTDEEGKFFSLFSQISLSTVFL